MSAAKPAFPFQLVETETEVICSDANGELWARLHASDRNRNRMEAVYKGLCLYYGQPIMPTVWCSAEEFREHVRH
jgi:hypothetical protein